MNLMNEHKILSLVMERCCHMLWFNVLSEGLSLTTHVPSLLGDSLLYSVIPIGKVYTSHSNLYGNTTLFCPLRGVLHFKYPQWGMQYFEIAFSRSAESSCDRASRSRVSSHAAERNRWRERACEKMCVGKHHFDISCRYAYTVRDTIYCT